eukprot:EC800025.1.p1 GENE.EC800025.1~~EC800025.1.p1  ORF type:complete len:162 (-),score=52.11 EC800025.1:17-502(-)
MEYARRQARRDYSREIKETNNKNYHHHRVLCTTPRHTAAVFRRRTPAVRQWPSAPQSTGRGRGETGTTGRRHTQVGRRDRLAERVDGAHIHHVRRALLQVRLSERVVGTRRRRRVGGVLVAEDDVAAVLRERLDLVAGDQAQTSVHRGREVDGDRGVGAVP